MRPTRPLLPLLVLACASSGAAQSVALDCGHNEVRERLLDFVARAEADAPWVALPEPPPRHTSATDGLRAVTPDDIFPFEDSSSVLLTDFDFDADLLPLMVDAANALVAEHGDEFDFIGYWLAFEPFTTIGAAFYLGIFNETEGLGLDAFDFRDSTGLVTNEIEGMVMMWDVNSSFWAPGTGPEADFTRLALGQEFEHRWAMFLPPLLDGRVLQGDDADCGRSAHWSWRVDGQGSSMEISEWVGRSPATLAQSFVSFNTDIPGSVFSYTDLYLMGYVTPLEMDAGNSELRFMDDSDCSASYDGLVSTLSSADIVATAGPRVPDQAAAEKDFRTGWVMFHLPGDPPTAGELQKAADILTQHQLDWETSTLGRGVMNDTLPSPFEDLGNGLAGTNGVPTLTGDGTLMPLSPVVLSLSGGLASTTTTLFLGAAQIDAPFKGGVLVPSPDVVAGGLVLDGAGSLDLNGTWPSSVPAGTEVFFQHWLVDPAGSNGLSASNGLKGTAQ